jgi:sarcosine oxidase subunit alpha
MGRDVAASEPTVTVLCDGTELQVPAGISVAAALFGAGHTFFRRSTSGEPRGPLCGMGVCYECRVTIDGVPHRRACLVTVLDGLHVVTGAGGAS